jgi:hypothetical protein
MANSSPARADHNEWMYFHRSVRMQASSFSRYSLKMDCRGAVGIAECSPDGG